MKFFTAEPLPSVLVVSAGPLSKREVPAGTRYLVGPVSSVVTRLLATVSVPGSNPGTTGSGMGFRFIRSLTAARISRYSL